MKTYVIPTIPIEGLSNSLFECFAIDVKNSKAPVPSLPMKVEAGVVCVCLRGTGKFVINNRTYEISKGSLITILPNSLICDASSSEDFLGFAVATAANVMSAFQMGDVVKGFIYISNHPVLEIKEQQIAMIVGLCEMLTQKRKDKKKYPFKEESIHHLLAVLCYEIYGYYMEQMDVVDAPVAGSRLNSVCQEFLSLVDRYATEHRELEFYADKLCLTSKYLSLVVKKVSGHSPIVWIDNAVMIYARALLSTSTMSVQQISAELHFPNPSFFGQYFKRRQGMTPKKYRDQATGN